MKRLKLDTAAISLRLIFLAGFLAGAFTLTGASPSGRRPIGFILTPTLASYPANTMALSTNTTVTPSAAPTDTTSMSVSAATDFKGKLEGDPITGVVRVTDAHPAGTYAVTVKAFGSGGETATKTFDLTVRDSEACDPPSFAAATNFGAGDGPVSVAVGDFNGDGIQDLATANLFANNVSILLGDGTGNFSGPTSFGTGTRPQGVAVGDFNGDGKQDLAVANDSESNNVSILLGDGMGGFSAATNFGAGTRPVSVAVGDFDSDGKQDLAVANFGSDSNNVSILLGDGAGNFSAATNFAVGIRPFSVAVGDFNGDGRHDLAVANSSSENVSILLGDGAGNFSAATNFAVGIIPLSVAVGDFNGDNKQDLAVENVGLDNVSILLGDGAGNFSAAINFGVSNSPRSIAVGDFNGDGRQDLATASFGVDNVSILLDNCALTLGNYPATSIPLSTDTTVPPDALPANITRMTVSSSTDFKGKLEGDPTNGVVRVTDAHPAGTYSVTVTGFSNTGVKTSTTFNLTVTTPATCTPVSFAAAVNSAAGTTPTSVAVGDFNGDGKQDLAVPNYLLHSVAILLGDGAGSFSAPTNFATGNNPTLVAVGDFNGDGKQDLATANQNSNVSILLGDGAGNFGAPTNFAANSTPTSVAVGDFNGDGKQDVAAANFNSANVSVLLGDGAGNFGAATNFGAGNGPDSVAVGDFNGDGQKTSPCPIKTQTTCRSWCGTALRLTSAWYVTSTRRSSCHAIVWSITDTWTTEIPRTNARATNVRWIGLPARENIRSSERQCGSHRC